jgi:hypothetical protein
LGVEIVLNLYEYAGNNPIVRIDSSGLKATPTPPPQAPPIGQWTVDTRIQRVNYYYQQCLAGQNPQAISGSGTLRPYFLTGCNKDDAAGYGIPTITAPNSSLIGEYYQSGGPSDRVRTCALFHEAKHVQQCKCKGSLGYAWMAQFSHPQMECEAYAQELKCLRGQIPDCLIQGVLNSNVLPYLK